MGSALFIDQLSESDQLLTILINAGMVSGALGYLAIDRRCFAIYAATMLAPLVGWAVIEAWGPDFWLDDHFRIALLLVGFFASLLISANSYSESMAESQRLADSNKGLRDKAQLADERTREHERMITRLSESDPMSGIGNRRFYEDRLLKEWGRCQREGRWISLIIVDIDHLHRLNNEHGYDAGDRCINQVGQLLANQIQGPRDVFARHGGDTFAILLPDADIHIAGNIARTLQRTLELEALPHPNSPIGPCVTVTCGLASMRRSEKSHRELWLAALEALFRGKEYGGNWIEAIDASYRGTHASKAD